MLEEAAIVPLTGLSKDVGTGVPEHSLTLWIIDIEELKATVSFKHTIQIPLLRVYLQKREKSNVSSYNP